MGTTVIELDGGRDDGGRNAASIAALRGELAATIQRCTPREGLHTTAIAGLTLFRATGPTEPSHGMYKPALVVVAQGAKRALLGDEAFHYDEAHCLLTSVDLPCVSQVVRASREQPYLCFALALQPQRIAELIADNGVPDVAPQTAAPRGMAVNLVSEPLLDAVLRLTRLLESPRDIDVLAPLVEREILYRLLTGEQGARLRRIAANAGPARQIARAIDWLKQHFAEALRIDELASSLHMSASSLHHHFKAVTAMSPLQYQKQLRLHEARRLMLAELIDAASAARRVGYESASQFSREYSRFYGAPPLRDVAQLRGQLEAAAL
jgi:AraC-like DNA-binding protein